MNCLTQTEEPISSEAIAELINEDEYDVELVLDDWVEFLQQQTIGGETRYRLYHSSFRDFIKEER